MSRTKNAVTNSVSLAGYQIIHIISGFILPRVLIGTYGSEVNGIVTSISQFLSYFSIAEAGLSSAIIYALYKPLADRDEQKISEVVSAGTLFYRQVSAIFFGLTCAMALIYPAFVRVSALSRFDMFWLVLILGGNTTMDFLAIARYRTLLTADQKSSVVYSVMSLQLVAFTGVVWLLASKGFSVIIVRLAGFACVFIRAILLAAYTKRRYPYINYRAKPDKAALNKRWDALYLQVFSVVYNSAPSVILTFTGSTMSIVSVYSVYNMFVAAVNGLLGIVSNGVTAGFGDLLSRKDMQGLRNAYHQYETAFLLCISVIYSVSSVMLLPIVKIYAAGFTDANYILPPLALLLVLNGYLYNIKTPLGLLIISSGMYKETRWRVTLQGAIVLIPGILLARFYSVYGILLAMIASNVYRCIDILYFVPKYITQERRSGIAVRWAISIFGAALVVVLGSLLNIAPRGYFEWIVYAAGMTILAIAVLLTLNLLFNRENVVQLIKRLVALLRASEKSKV